jgi:sphinganine-1-phosphate aldolase
MILEVVFLGLIATCWASMMYYGRAGYVEATKKIVETQRYIDRE